MGIAKMRICFDHVGIKGYKGIKSKLLASVLLQLPDGTTLCGIDCETDNNYMRGYLYFGHPSFIDGAEIDASFKRDISINGDTVEVFDHFVGIDLKKIIYKED